MGGAAYNVGGSVAPHLIPSTPLPDPPRPSFLQRLFSATPAIDRRSHVVISRNGDRHFEIMPGSLSHQLPADFKEWIHRKLNPPSRATQVVMDYLKYGGPSIYVRGLLRVTETEPVFWVQVSFSGCAGEAEVSANVAAHWTALWHEARAAEIKRAYLQPFGFEPKAEESAPDHPPIFVPADDLGYLELNSPEARERYGEPTFALDHSAEEAFPDRSTPERLEHRFTEAVSQGRCRCQLCDPDLVMPPD